MPYTLEELLPVVKTLSEKYTRKESTSVTYEAAEKLMEAVLYCVNLYENKYAGQGTTQLAADSEKTPANEAYQQGYRILMRKTLQTNQVYNNLIISFDAYGNINYYDTIVKGMPAFFRYYDTKFNPADYILTLDYPILVLLEDKCGVERIYDYLQAVKLEQEFLKKLPRQYILWVLNQYSNDYKDLFFNVCSVVLRNVLLFMLAGRQPNTKGMDEEAHEIIEWLVSENTREQLEKILRDKLKLLITQAYDGNEELYQYLLKDNSDFAVELMNAVQNHCLKRLC